LQKSILRTAAIFILSLISSILVSAQHLVHKTRDPAITSGRYSDMSCNGLAASLNPAMLPYQKSLTASIFMQKRFMLRELGSISISLCAPIHHDGVSVLLQQSGNGDFKEKTVGVGYGKRFGNVTAGVDFRYINLLIGNNAKLSTIYIAPVALFSITTDFSLFVKAANPHLFSQRSTAMRPASSYSIGAGWQISSAVYAGVETVKEEKTPLAVTTSLLYSFSNRCGLALSWCVDTNEPFISFTCNFGTFKSETGSGFHSTLGLTPFAAMLFENSKTTLR
jgi:hypothetical protein